MPLVRSLLLVVAVVLVAACSNTESSAEDSSTSTSEPVAIEQAATEESTAGPVEAGPGGYGFDRSDPDSGIANIMEAFATDEATAACIHEAWGDVANVPPAELTPELMTFEICGTSIFELMTGDPRFTGSDG